MNYTTLSAFTIIFVVIAVVSGVVILSGNWTTPENEVLDKFRLVNRHTPSVLDKVTADDPFKTIDERTDGEGNTILTLALTRDVEFGVNEHVNVGSVRGLDIDLKSAEFEINIGRSKDYEGKTSIDAPYVVLENNLYEVGGSHVSDRAYFDLNSSTTQYFKVGKASEARFGVFESLKSSDSSNCKGNFYTECLDRRRRDPDNTVFQPCRPTKLWIFIQTGFDAPAAGHVYLLAGSRIRIIFKMNDKQCVELT